jgi:hypothetical protein
MTTIRTFANQIDAAFDMSLLQANGFDAVLLDEASFQWNYAGAAIPIRLQVPEDQARQAIEYLQDFHSAKPTSEDVA